MRVLAALGWALLLILLSVFIALATYWATLPARADEEHMRMYHSDPRYDAFFKSLRRPDGQGSCCSLDDCRQTEAKLRDGRWFAIVEGKWREVPPEKVLTAPLSIDGEAYICHGDSWPGGTMFTPYPGGAVYTPPYDGAIFCFIPPIPGY
jgi:hypothetical protein